MWLAPSTPSWQSVPVTVCICLSTESFLLLSSDIESPFRVAVVHCFLLQSCKRSLEGAQAENLNLSRDLFNLKLTMQGHEPPGNPAGSVNAHQAWPAAFAPAPRASILSSGGFPGVRASPSRASTASGAARGSEAAPGLGPTAAGFEQRSRESLALLGAISPGSILVSQSGALPSGTNAGGTAGRPSSAAYGAGRLSALPSGLVSSSSGELPATSPGRSLSPARGPYAASANTARKAGNL